MTTQYEGGCTCGQVRYRVTDKPMYVHCCHCTWCQRASGAAFALNAMIESDRVELLSGEVETIDTPTESGGGQKISRCVHCKDAVWSSYAVPKIGDSMRFVRVGTLDEPASMPPSIHIFTSSKQGWVGLPDDVPNVPRYYKAKELWPSESLDRRRALESV